MASQLTPLSADQINPIPAEVRAQAFPVLTAAQISRIRPLSKVRSVKAGDILFEPGDTDIPFFVLLSGSMEIVQPERHAERLIVKSRSRRVYRRNDHDLGPPRLGARPRY